MDNFIEQIIKVKPIVVDVLKNNEEARDYDNIMLFAVWDKQYTKEINNYSELKRLVLDGILSTPETIRRTRAKLQEIHPELRGKLYAKRKKQGLLVKNQMKLIFNNEK